ncbi:2'-5' RNA ligase family protein [Nodosilinea sp. LEGE 06152]|uniref:2'-5' RNA ligase family protein n=1 Tax=Nodosilinea sp. LEGE 06152 TaxID=2777966 RepID=UPI00187F040A|nr:2'-5' RNA ligase family protein [Nodosilinea sp. LEGE 06152]MBE9156207.1 2'-5' RNA ligase family protein [Nodosilinea sp. LEGE 06152]
MAKATADRFFVALLPPQPLQDEITAIKQEIWQRFDSKAALKSPPHITLQPPFLWPLPEAPRLEDHLKAFAQTQPAVPIQLRGYSAFAPRVIYIDVAQTAQLMAMQPAIAAHLAESCGLVDRVGKARPFTPHLTVGFRDLSPAAFRQAWAEFEQRPFTADFVAQALALLHHDGKVWQVFAELPLQAPSP